ncbi:MAG TPA: hypothetical protein VHR42_07070 [Clostridia bacterium]|nr:hypothetical protein [Clostridia bacterium]
MKIAEPDKIEEMYEKNLSLLTPWLRETLAKISLEELNEKIEVTYNSEGYPVCRYHRDGLCFHVTSENPVQEAEAWYRSVQHVGSSETILYGSGFGYALFEVFAHKVPHTLVVVFEQDLFLFKAMLCYFDLSPIIETQKILFLIGDSSFFKKAFEELFFTMQFFQYDVPEHSEDSAGDAQFQKGISGNSPVYLQGTNFADFLPWERS